MADVYDMHCCPREPSKPDFGKRPTNDTPLTDEYKKKRGPIVFVAGFVAICSLISGGLFSGDFLTIILNIIILAACGFVIFKIYKKINELKATDEKVTIASIESYEDSKKEKEEKYEQDMIKYQTLMNSHKLLKADFLEEYAKWRVLYLKRVKEEEKIEEKLEADRLTMVKKIEDEEFIPALNDLAEFNDLITTEYLPAIDVIIDLLKSGRADDLKEAINLYEDILYRERQLQLQREQEEQRRYEEELRRQDEERRHREEIAFQREQERNRQREFEETQRREAEKQKKEELERYTREKRAAEDARREQLKEAAKERDLKAKQNQAAKAQCRACAYAGRCNMSIYNVTPNCTGFRPR